MPTEIRFRNEVGGAYRMMSAELLVDGTSIRRFSAAETASATSPGEIPAFRGPMTSGSHLVTARVEFQGRNRGPFTYLDGYRFVVETSGAMVVPDDRGPTGFIVVTRERKGMNVPMERRLEVAIERIAGR